MSDDLKRQAAQAAADAELRNGMRVGLGTGSTAKHFVDIVGARIKAGERFLCVPTSEATRMQAESLSIPLTTLDAVETLDLTVDGADELDENRTLIKGGGAALLREKMVAANSTRMVVIADASKCVKVLGAFPLPIEIVQFCPQATIRAVRRAFDECKIQMEPRLRLTPAKSPLMTDNGNFIIDCMLNDAKINGMIDPSALAARLTPIPGLVEHGLFIALCAAAYIAKPEGVQLI